MQKCFIFTYPSGNIIKSLMADKNYNRQYTEDDNYFFLLRWKRENFFFSVIGNEYAYRYERKVPFY